MPLFVGAVPEVIVAICVMADILLMNKDKPVASFREFYKLGQPLYEMQEQFDPYLPYGFGEMNSWLEHRPAGRQRKHIAEIMKQCGCDNARGYIDIMHAVSLTDTFWVKGAGSDLVWQDVSLYQNEFDDMIARTAFDGTGLHDIEFSPGKISPELATDGQYDKCWHRNGDRIYLMKSGTEGYANAGMEPYSEKLASDLLDHTSCRHVHYDIGQFHGKLVSSCELFTDERVGFVPFSSFLTQKGSRGSLGDILRFADETGISEDFYHMLAMDAVFVNTDRHTGNFGFLVDNDDGHILSMAPLFDHNLALRPDMMEGDNWQTDVVENCDTAFGTDFIVTAKDAMNRYPEIRSELIQLKSFEFTNPGRGFPEWRVAVLNEMKDFQISRILDQQKTLEWRVGDRRRLPLDGRFDQA